MFEANVSCLLVQLSIPPRTFLARAYGSIYSNQWYLKFTANKDVCEVLLIPAELLGNRLDGFQGFWHLG